LFKKIVRITYLGDRKDKIVDKIVHLRKLKQEIFVKDNNQENFEEEIKKIIDNF